MKISEEAGSVSPPIPNENEGWPSINPAAFSAAHRIENPITGEQRRRALESSMRTVNEKIRVYADDPPGVGEYEDAVFAFARSMLYGMTHNESQGKAEGGEKKRLGLIDYWSNQGNDAIDRITRGKNSGRKLSSAEL